MTDVSKCNTRITRLASETADKLRTEYSGRRPMFNFEPILTAALTDLATQIREEDAPYMQHLPDCEVTMIDGCKERCCVHTICTCGLAALRARTA